MFTGIVSNLCVVRQQQLSLILLLSVSVTLATHMATITNTFIFKPPISHHPKQLLYSHRSSLRFLTKFKTPSGANSRRLVPKATAAPGAKKTEKPHERVQRVHSVEEFESALESAKDRLVVVEYAASDSEESSQIYPFMVELSRSCNDVEFILVMGDESEKTKELLKREKVENVPHFSFYKSKEKIHEEEGIGPDMLVGDVLYYGDNHSGVVQLHNVEDVQKLIEDHKLDHKLIVLDVGLKHCGPCVKVYPTVVKLSRQMDSVVFARMNGDENESCMQFLKDMEVIQVPTFLFIRDGNIEGKGELIGEILRYQGVRITY